MKIYLTRADLPFNFIDELQLLKVVKCLGNTVSIFKVDNKMRTYVEVYAIPAKNKKTVSELLSKVTMDTSEEDIQIMFKGLCKVRTKSDFLRVRQKNRRNNVILTMICAFTMFIYLMITYYQY